MTEYYQGLGRRKTSCARVRLYRGEEGFVINGKPATEFFDRPEDLATCLLPLQVAERLGQYAVSVKVEGGGISGQAGAVRHGIARALIEAEPELRPALKQAGLLTRDPRVKERKKPGLKRARKAPQYTKR
ncbi:MAG: 30S ribosomal protein S9 [Anaerolineales bacterium]